MRFSTTWAAPIPPTNRKFDPKELVPRGFGWTVRHTAEGRGVEAMEWDVLNGSAPYPMTNVRNLGLPQWKRLAENPENRCLVPVVEFAEWTPDKFDLGDGKKPVKGEMWFSLPEQPLFAIAGFWRQWGDKRCFSMVTCDPNELIAPIHPKAMVTILDEDKWDRWLTGSYEDVVALQQPYPADKMTVRGPVFPTRGIGA